MQRPPPTSRGAFGELVRRRRRALDLTQQQLARQVSCSEDMIRKIEADLRRPSRWLAERLSKHLQVDAADLHAFRQAARLEPAKRSVQDATPAPAALPMIGRSSEWARWRAALDGAHDRRAALLFIEGEPGIGKSHFARAALADAGAAGFLTCAAACYEIDRAIPLQPLIDWIDGLLDTLGPELLESVSTSALGVLAELSPQVRALRPDLPLAAAEPELRRTRIFNAFAELAGAGLRRAPMLIVVEDIHWADEMTLALLHHLVRQMRHARFALVCTFRSDELAGHAALAAWVRSAGVEPGGVRIALSRWTEADVQTLIDAEAPGGPATLAARLFRNSDGHPLYVTSMLQQLQERGPDALDAGDASIALPPALRDSILERVGRLDASTRAVLDTAAVLGRSFDFLTLERAARMPDAALADAIDLLVQRRLLREIDGVDDYDFSHDRIREAVYESLGAARRIVLHRSAAEALIDSGADNPALVAEHWELAHQWDAAIRQHERAAQRSLGLSALREAARAVERALAIAKAHPAAATDEMQVRLRERLGDVHAQDGRSAEAVQAFEAALQDARRLDDAAWTRDLLTKLGMAHRRADDYARAVDCLGQSLAASRALGEPQRVADTLYHLGTVAWSDGDNTLALRLHREAVALCEEHALSGLVAVQAYHGDGEARFSAGQPHAAMARFERSLALARAIEDRGYEAENLMMLGYCCSGAMGLADSARAAAYASSGLAIAEAAEQAWHLTPLRILQAEVWRGSGHSEAAIALVRGELERIEGLGQTRFGIMALDLLGRSLLERERAADAEDCFQRAVDLGVSRRVRFWRGQVLAGLALARLQRGAQIDPIDLRAAAEIALASGERFGHARCLQALAEAELQAGRFDAARADAEQVLAVADEAGLREFSAHGRWLLARAWLASAPRRAEAELTRALDSARAIDRAWLAWRICDDLASLHQRARRTRLADDQRAAALEWRKRCTDRAASAPPPA
jgi:tetratricopeptide (TPR) repeat protein/transcriptional regulator with XRE-family HTH domain